MRAAKQFLTFAGGTPFQHARRRRAAPATTRWYAAFARRAAGQARPALRRAAQPRASTVLRPQGTYFANADVARRHATAPRSAASSPQRAGVVAIPTSVFSADPRARCGRYVRFAFCKRAGGHRRGRDAVGTAPIRLKELIRKVVDGMEEHDLLTYASAIAFQVMTSLIPLALLVLAAMGSLHLETVWTHDLGPQFRAQVSKEVYAVGDDVVRRTLSQEQLWWLTAGLVVTVWQVSGAARAIMGVLSEVYNDGEDRSFRRRYVTSIALGMGVTVLVLAAFASARFGGEAVGGPVGFVLRLGRRARAPVHRRVAVAPLRPGAPRPAPLDLLRLRPLRDRLGRHLAGVRAVRHPGGRLQLDLRLAGYGFRPVQLPLRVVGLVPDRGGARRDRA